MRGHKATSVVLGFLVSAAMTKELANNKGNILLS
jgi:hypothetical protein